jgi:hypothetical protein
MEYRSQEINNLDLFNAAPGLYIEKAVKDFVLTSPLNCMVDFQNKPFFGETVLTFANGDSPIFKNLKQTVSESHLLPREILENQIPIPFRIKPGFELKNVMVIAGALPVNPEIIRAEARSQYGSSLIHNHMNCLGGHWGFLKAVCDYIEVLFYILGHSAVAPFFSPLFRDEPKKMAENCRKTVCNWSERHVAEACGLGTFG